MRKFNINVDGKSYVVEVEEVGGATVATAPVVSAAPAPVAAAPKAAPAVAGKGEPVVSPMPGVVLEINVANGATVKAGDTILVIEAMKMENPIAAPKAGVVSVAVSKGASINSGDVLFTIA